MMLTQLNQLLKRKIWCKYFKIKSLISILFDYLKHTEPWKSESSSLKTQKIGKIYLDLVNVFCNHRPSYSKLKTLLHMRQNSWHNESRYRIALTSTWFSIWKAILYLWNFTTCYSCNIFKKKKSTNVDFAETKKNKKKKKKKNKKNAKQCIL